MEGLIAVREKIREIYAARSRVFDKTIQFVLAFATFFLINKNVGFMEMAASPAASLALAVICTFFPMIITVFAAAALILLHMFSASLGMLAVTGLIFLIMFVFYLRFTPKMAMVARIGTDRGRMILRNTVGVLAPSITADSSSEAGMA